MGRIPCCEKDNVKRGQWTPEEDNKLASYIAQHGTRNWRLIPKHAGLQRCGKSCRLRWTNYLRPDLKHGEFTEMEEQTIIKFHAVLGNRWSIIAAQLPGRTDNDVKNHWNTKLKKRLSGMGIDPVTHKPFSHLMAEIATALPPPQVAHLAEAALGCFKDEMLHFLTKKRSGNDFGVSGSGVQHQHQMVQNQAGVGVGEEDAVQRIRMGLSRAMMEEKSGAWEVEGMSCDDVFQGMGNGFQCDGEGSEWSTCVGGERKDDGVGGADGRSGKGVFGGESSSDCVLWDLTDDIMNL